ncbi:MAG: hypothetical protein AAF358_25695 [Pseudomonadota bacterium]
MARNDEVVNISSASFDWATFRDLQDAERVFQRNESGANESRPLVGSDLELRLVADRSYTASTESEIRAVTQSIPVTILVSSSDGVEDVEIANRTNGSGFRQTISDSRTYVQREAVIRLEDGWNEVVGVATSSSYSTRTATLKIYRETGSSWLGFVGIGVDSYAAYPALAGASTDAYIVEKAVDNFRIGPGVSNTFIDEQATNELVTLAIHNMVRAVRETTGIV